MTGEFGPDTESGNFLFKLFTQFSDLGFIFVVEGGVVTCLEVSFFSGGEFLSDGLDVFVFDLEFAVEGESLTETFVDLGFELGSFSFEDGLDLAVVFGIEEKTHISFGVKSSEVARSQCFHV